MAAAITEIMPDRYRQQNLFDSEGTDKPVLMMAVDAINRKWGRQTVQLAAAGLKKPWQMVQSRKSPDYTTNWLELPVAKA